MPKKKRMPIDERYNYLRITQERYLELVDGQIVDGQTSF